MFEAVWLRKSLSSADEFPHLTPDQTAYIVSIEANSIIKLSPESQDSKPENLKL